MQNEVIVYSISDSLGETSQKIIIRCDGPIS